VTKRWRRIPSALAFAATLTVQACATGGGRGEAAAVPRGWPVKASKAVVTSLFGAPRGRSTHQGIDLSMPKGSKVWSTAPGRVTFAGKSGDFGRLVVVDHGGGWETRYAHLKSIEVKRGKKVDRRQTVGTVGKSGNASGYHLHYEIRRNGTAVDPVPYLVK
jgi:murein DD-endopeptidase MepM/ murein hydrolase activator NlpD